MDKFTIRDRYLLDTLKAQQTQHIDFHQRRITNAAPSVNAYDYVTRKELDNVVLAGGLSGTGTVQTISKFVGTTVIGDSYLQQDNNKLLKHSVGVVSSVPDIQDLNYGLSLLHDSVLPGNEWLLSSLLQIPVTSSPTSYEKVAAMVWAITDDPSDYTGTPKTRDAVGLDVRGIITAINSQGRAWGIYTEAACAGDGFLSGIEVVVSNGGADSNLNSGNFSKTGIGINNGTSTAHVTSAIFIASSSFASTFGFHHGVVIREDSIVDDAYCIVKSGTDDEFRFRIKPSGQTLVGDLNNDATLGNYDAAIYGTATFNTNVTIVDSSNNKNLLLFFTDTGTSRHRISTGHYDTPASTWPLSLEINAVEALTINVDGASLFGLTSSPVTIAQGNILVKNYAFIADASSNAHVGVLATDAGSSSIIVGSDKTGAASLWPINFRIGSDDWMTVEVDGGIKFKASAAAISGAGEGRIRYNVAADKFEISENGGAYAAISTGSGGGSIGGVGTAGTIAKFSSATDIADSALVEGTAITTSKSFLPNSNSSLDIGASGGFNFNELYIVSIKTDTAATALRVLNLNAQPVILGVSGGDVWQVTASGHWEPVTDNAYNVGSSSKRPITVYGNAFNIGTGSLTLTTSGQGIIFGTTSIAFVAAGMEFYQNSSVRATVNSGGFTVTGTCTATTFSGSGASLTSIPATAISSGTLSDSRLSSNVPLKNGANTFSATMTMASVNTIFSAGFGVGNSAGTSVAFASGGLEFYVGGVVKGTISSSSTTLMIDGAVRTLHNTGGTCTLT